MSKVICPMPHCINRGPEGECMSGVIELMFGIVMQLSGRGAEAYLRCAQHKTQKDLDEE